MHDLINKWRLIHDTSIIFSKTDVSKTGVSIPDKTTNTGDETDGVSGTRRI